MKGSLVVLCPKNHNHKLFRAETLWEDEGICDRLGRMIKGSVEGRRTFKRLVLHEEKNWVCRECGTTAIQAADDNDVAPIGMIEGYRSMADSLLLHVSALDPKLQGFKEMWINTGLEMSDNLVGSLLLFNTASESYEIR